MATALAVTPLLWPTAGLGQTVDLGNLGDRGFRIEGASEYDQSGFSVSGAGDVNGDGLADLIIGAPEADGGGYSSGESFVVFGKADSGRVNLLTLQQNSNGFQIDGPGAADRAGISVSGAGDVNGDGLDDLIVGVYGGDPGGNNNAGETYVVFGKTDSARVRLGSLGSRGFRIDGIDADDESGRSVSGAGDVNGDGLADLVIGARNADSVGFTNSGEIYVVFGKTTSTPVDLAALGSGGFQIDGVGGVSGFSVAGAGDVNGDGLSDVIIGAPSANSTNGESAGLGFVVFGKADSTVVDLINLGSDGFRIEGRDDADATGFSVSGAGDVNGDGRADLVIGANTAQGIGEIFVVFGKANSLAVDLRLLGSDGFRILGIDDQDYSGQSVSGAGDINGDGLADLLMSSFRAAGFAGESYVVFGKTNGLTVDLAILGTTGFRIDGASAGDQSGFSVSGAGDVNGDGLADWIIGAPEAKPRGNETAGESYVVFSASIPPPNASYRALSRNGDAPQTAVGITGDGSNASSPDSRFWIDFSDGNDLLTSASTEIVGLNRNRGAFTAPAAEVSWRLQTTRQDWTAAEVTVRYLESELLIDTEHSLQLVFSINGSAPFTPLTSTVNPIDNTISANITQAGFLYIGDPDLLFQDGFESTPL